MAGQVNIGGSSGLVQLVGNDSLSTDQQVGFPDTSGADSTVVVTPTDQVIETSGGISHPDNTGNPNIVLYPDGSSSVGRATVNSNLLDNSSFRINQRAIYDSATSNGFMCDRWSTGNRSSWSIERGFDSLFNNGVGPFGAYAVKAGSAAVWETGIELQNETARNGTHVNPVAYTGCEFVLSAWAYRPTNDIDQFGASVAYRPQTNIAGGGVIFFNANMTRTADSMDIGGKIWWRYQTLIKITSDPDDTQRVLYVGFGNLSDGDLLACPKLERGSTWTPWQPEPLQYEALRCYRYFWFWSGKKYAFPDSWSGSGSDSKAKFANFDFPAAMAYDPMTKTTNPGIFTDVNTVGANYRDNQKVDQVDFCSNAQFSAEMTSFQTWRP